MVAAAMCVCVACTQIEVVTNSSDMTLSALFGKIQELSQIQGSWCKVADFTDGDNCGSVLKLRQDPGEKQ